MPDRPNGEAPNGEAPITQGFIPFEIARVDEARIDRERALDLLDAQMYKKRGRRKVDANQLLLFSRRHDRGISRANQTKRANPSPTDAGRAGPGIKDRSTDPPRPP